MTGWHLLVAMAAAMIGACGATKYLTEGRFTAELDVPVVFAGLPLDLDGAAIVHGPEIRIPGIEGIGICFEIDVFGSDWEEDLYIVVLAYSTGQHLAIWHSHGEWLEERIEGELPLSRRSAHAIAAAWQDVVAAITAGASDGRSSLA